MGLRRQRIQPGRPNLFWDELAVLPIDVELPLTSTQAKLVMAMAEQLGLTVYDAAYLELAHRRDLPIATLDSALLGVASRAGVDLIAAAKP
jgi:predicted nucleic acid-binding protein